jgi:hypothetical protein
MVSIQEAAKNAMDFAQVALAGYRTPKLRLEEVESGSEDGQPVWKITLSITEPGQEPKEYHQLSIAGIKSQPVWLDHREYKVFTVVKDTGEVLSIKMRSPVLQ